MIHIPGCLFQVLPRHPCGSSTQDAYVCNRKLQGSQGIREMVSKRSRGKTCFLTTAHKGARAANEGVSSYDARVPRFQPRLRYWRAIDRRLIIMFNGVFLVFLEARCFGDSMLWMSKFNFDSLDGDLQLLKVQMVFSTIRRCWLLS